MARAHRRLLLAVVLVSLATPPARAADPAVPPAGGDRRAGAAASPAPRPITTFSIVAWDPETGDYGVGVQSKYFAVGDVVPFAEARVGALATQARGNLRYGPDGLALLAAGSSARLTLATLTGADPLRASRQVGIVDARGRAATWTGSECLPWAGGRTGEHYAVQGNLLAGPQVIDAMAATYEAAPGDLATRLVTALAAGQAAGGDARGRQSAAVLVVREGAGYLGLTDRYIHLHVEDHATPIRELRRLLDIRHAQIASGEAETALAGLDDVDPAERRERIRRAREAVERGLDTWRGDDHLWWLAARIRLLDGDGDEAVEAGRSALLLSPSWPTLPASTRSALGVDPALVEALRQDPGFDRLWESLARQTGSP